MTKKKTSIRRGIWVFSGDPDSGKTSISLGNGAKTEEIVFIDDDLKSSGIVEQLEEQGSSFAEYLNLATLPPSWSEVQTHELFLKAAGIGTDWTDKPKKGAEVIVIDNYTRIQRTYKPYVDLHEDRFNKVWNPMGIYKGAQKWQTAGEYEKFILGCLKDRYRLVIITSHLKDQTINGVKTGNMVPDFKRVLAQTANCVLWLLRGVDGGIPSALVLKRPTKWQALPILKPINVLPLKLPVCTWEVLEDYWENPVGDTELTNDQVPTKEELETIKGIISKRDKELMLETIAHAEQQEEAERKGELNNTIKDLAASGMKKIPMLAELKKRGFDVELKDLP